MDMGMILQGSSPGVKHTEEAGNICADEVLIEGEFFDGVRGGLEQGGVSHALVLSDEGAQFFWHRKRNEEMMAGELALELFLKPLLSLMVLASRAMAIATGAIELVGLVAFFALVVGNATEFSATGGDRINGFAVCFGHQVGVTLEVLGAEGCKDFTDGGHGRVPPSRD